jgi:flavin reductase (DIM6/NTAB) family NADH-FMN oxidoreductase RutF
MSNSDFDKVLRSFPTGISVVTVGRGGVENGLTVSWASPVSFDPPQFLIAVNKNHYSTELLDSTKNFVINVLKKDQSNLAGHFAKPSFSDREKLDGVTTREAPSGGAILEDALAYFDCEVVGSHNYGDHNIYVGKVIDAGLLGEGDPLTTLEGMQYVKKST